ncbi:hypothetical protein [Streptomyces sp. 2A115]|uniref:hypothetical protein n=1 Tax=Streptomyces sp. 2A115 TaxID=3457439 RepID=UPI003FD0A29E
MDSPGGHRVGGRLGCAAADLTGHPAVLCTQIPAADFIDLRPVDRLAKLRALEEWLDWQLNSTRRKIREVTAQVEQDHRARERAYAEQR